MSQQLSTIELTVRVFDQRPRGLFGILSRYFRRRSQALRLKIRIAVLRLICRILRAF